MPDSALSQRRLPIGAEVLRDGSVHFRVWAPRRNVVEVTFDDAQPLRLDSERNGYFSGTSKHARAETRYRFRLDGDAGKEFPDPTSRYQPEGPHGPSMVVDPGVFRWTDSGWKGVSPAGQVLYEMHVGSFTPQGMWTSAQAQLPALKEVGVTCLEVMPVCEFPGRFGWGYDGVDLFAPTRLYGTPDDMRRFVDAAHAVGLG